MSARERVLARLRAAPRPSFDGLRMGGGLRMSDKLAASDGLGTSASDTPLALSLSKGELLARFRAELTALGVEHHVESTPDAVRARVAAIVGDRPVLRWDVDRLPYGVGELLAHAADGASARDVQAAAAVGVTGCDAAIAETGSLAMITGRGKPRAASLLPPTHLAIVGTDQLCETMGAFFRERAADLAAAANCTFITGPSRTADIELTLTVGVHGPGRVVVIVGP